MEILSPAGTPEGLVAAVKGGCDAVYLAGKRYGARSYAGNFTDKEIEGAISYAHDRGVRVHVAVNTAIRDREMDDAVSFVRFLRDVDADAVLIQDLGLLKSVSHIDIAKHASTQMGIHSVKGLEWCAENGIDRAVLARELTFDELSAIVPESPVETEVFVQGALCYCMSGGCLMSAFMGGRSGNRGKCAQPCRKKYSIAGKEGYLLSCADLMGVEWIERLRSIGVDALKIEGRMRSPAYAYLATKAYALAEDGDLGHEYGEAMNLLKTVFNRGVCDGYFGGVVSPVQSLYPDNRGYRLGTAEIGNRRFVRTDFCDIINAGDGLSVYDGEDKVGGFRVSEAETTVPFPIRDGRYDVYRTYDPRIDSVKNLIGPPPRLDGKAVRRRVEGTVAERKPHRAENPDRSFYVSGIRVLQAVLPYADRVYWEWNSGIAQARRMCEDAGAEFVLILPRFDAADCCEYDGNVMIANPSSLGHAGKVFAHHSMNVFNSLFPEVYQATLSPELSRNEISELTARYPSRTEVMAFGRTELMYSRDPGMPEGMMSDGERSFPVYRDPRGFVRVLNSADLFLLDRIDELGGSGVSSVGIDVRKRPLALAEAVASYSRNANPALRKRIEEMCGRFDSTLYFKGLKD